MLGRTNLIPLRFAVDDDSGDGVRDWRKPLLSEFGTAKVGTNFANSRFLCFRSECFFVLKKNLSFIFFEKNILK